MKYVLPTFMIPGAAKSGTSYLAYVLGRHPDVCMTCPKEPRFFSTYPAGDYPVVYHKGLGFYRKYFLEYRGQKHIGDASQIYFVDPASPRLIHQHIPDVKLIFSLRNPIDRVYSNYWEEIKNGRKHPDFKTFLFSKHEKIIRMIDCSRYDIHLRRYFAQFSRDQMLILLYDDLKNNLVHTIDTILSFLGLEPFPEGEDLDIIVNPPFLPRPRILYRLLTHPTLSTFFRGILSPKMILLLRRVMRVVRPPMRRPFQYPPMDEESRSYLANELQGTIQNLSVMLGRDLSHWR